MGLLKGGKVGGWGPSCSVGRSIARADPWELMLLLPAGTDEGCVSFTRRAPPSQTHASPQNL